MRLFRHPVLRRLLALALIAGLGGWAAAPLATAHPRLAAAQAAQQRAGGPLERVLADALAESAHAPENFAEVLTAALTAPPDGEALARYIEAAGSSEALLDLLVGQLLRNAALPGPLLALGVAPAAPAAAGGSLAAPLAVVSFGAPPAPVAAAAVPVPYRPIGLLRALSAAQPLGP